MNTLNYTEYRDLQSDTQYNKGWFKCKNYKLCESMLSDEWYIYITTCIYPSYNIFGSNDLEFGENTEEFDENTEDCDICFESNNKYVKVSTSCNHRICVGCSQNMLVWDETKYRLSPVPYGCPPCPNKCFNPIKGEQCYCTEYDEILDRWKKEYPDEYKEYNDDEKTSIELSETTNGVVYGSYKCPLCIKKY